MKYKVLGVRIDCVNGREADGAIRRLLGERRQAAVFTPNLLMIGKECRHETRALLNLSDLNIADGSGVLLLLRRLGCKDAERVAGIDVARRVLDSAAKERLRVYLLGGKETVAADAAAALCRALPSLLVCGTHHGYFDLSRKSAEWQAVVRNINESGADILFVCLGYPRQERFILECRSHLPRVRLLMGLGGSLDVWSERTRRAPRMLQAAHLEWLWRCLCTPSKLREALTLPLIFAKALRHRS